MAMVGESYGTVSGISDGEFGGKRHREELVCEKCGDEGLNHLLVQCAKCHIAYEHCYCLEKLSYTTSVHFVCGDCSELPVKESLPSDSNKGANFRKRARVESSNPVPRWKKIPETAKMKLISPEEVRNLSSGGLKSNFKVPKHVPPRSTTGLTKPAAYVPRTLRLNSAPLDSKPKSPNPRSLQSLSGVIRRDSQAHAVVEGSKSKVGNGSMSYGSGDISQSILLEKLEQLLPYQPALDPTWKGHIVDSATPCEFSGEFLAQPASRIRKKPYKLSKAIPRLLKAQLVPIDHSLLNKLFENRTPELSDIQVYIFHDDNSSKRLMEDHAHLFEAMKTHNAMIRINIKDTPLLIFSSKLLDNASQLFIKMQKKTSNFLWGIFLSSEKSLALVPGSSNQSVKLDDGDVFGTTIKRQRFRRSSHRDIGKNLERN